MPANPTKEDRPTMASTDRTQFTDADLIATLDGRIRQLEGELEGNRISALEADADPHDDSSADVHRRNMESLTARLTVVRAERAKLKTPKPATT